MLMDGDGDVRSLVFLALVSCSSNIDVIVSSRVESRYSR